MRARLSGVRLAFAIVGTLALMLGAGQRSAPKAAALGAHTVSAVTGPCTPVTPVVLSSTFTTDLTVAAGGTVTSLLGIPTGATFATSGPLAGCPGPIGLGTNQIAYGPCIAPSPPGQTITQTFNVPSGMTTTTETVTYNSNGPVTPSSATGSCAEPDNISYSCEAFMLTGIVPGNTVSFLIDTSHSGAPLAGVPTACGPRSAVTACTPATSFLGTCPLTSNTINGASDMATVTYTCGPGQSSPAQDVLVNGSDLGVTGPPTMTVTIAGVSVPTPTDVIYGLSTSVPNGGVATAAAPFCVPSGATTFQCSYYTSEAMQLGGTLTETIVVPIAGAVFTSASPLSNCGAPAGIGTPSLTYGPCAAASPTGQAMTATVSVPGGTSLVTAVVTYNANGPFIPGGATGDCTNSDSEFWTCQMYLPSQAVPGDTIQFSFSVNQAGGGSLITSVAHPVLPAGFTGSTCPFTTSAPANGTPSVTYVLTYTCGPGQSAAATVTQFAGDSNANLTLNPTAFTVVGDVAVGTGIVVSSLLPFSCVLSNATTMNCSVPNPVSLPAGATLQASVLVPLSGVQLNTSTSLPGCGAASGQGTSTITYGPCTSTSPAGSVLVEQITVPLGVHTVTEVFTYNFNGPITPTTTTGDCTSSDSVNFLCDNYMAGPAVPGDTATFKLSTASSGTGSVVNSVSAFPGALGSCPLQSSPPQPQGLGTNTASINYVCGIGQLAPAQNVTVTGASNGFTGAPTETTQVCCIAVPPNRAAAAYILTAPGLGGPVTSTISKTCVGPGGTTPQPGQTDTCTVMTGADQVPVAGSVEVTLQTPAFTAGTLVCTGVSGVTTATVSGSTCVFQNVTGAVLPAGTTAGTEVFQVAVGTPPGTAVTQNGLTCLDSAVPCTVSPGTCGSPSLPGPCAVTCTGSGCSTGGPAPATVKKTCSGPGGSMPQPGQIDTCTVMTGADQVPISGSVEVTLQTPAFTAGTLVCTGVSGVTVATVSGSTCVFQNTSGAPLAAGTTVGTEAFQVAAGTASGTAVTQNGVTCLDTAVPCSVSPGTCGSSSAPGPCPVMCTGNGCLIGGPPTATIKKTCIGPGGSVPQPGLVDTCTVMTGADAVPVAGSVEITLQTPGFAPGSLVCTGVTGVTVATVSGSTCVFQNASASMIPPGTTVGTEAFQVAAGTAPGTAVTQNGLTCVDTAVPCTVSPGTCGSSGAPGPCPVMCTGNGCTIAGAPTPPPVPTPLPPVGETTTCAVPNGDGTVSVQGPTQSFTIPLFTSGPAECFVQLQQAGGVNCSGVNAPTSCTDGTLQLTLSSPGTPALMSCNGGPIPGLPPGFIPTGATTAGCIPSANGTVLNLPCGAAPLTSAPVNDASCVGVVFNVSGALSACVSAPTAACGGLSGATFGANVPATITKTFLASPSTGGPSGGVLIGTDTFAFRVPKPGLLLVATTPQLIPSNGTIAAVVSATFACGTQTAQLVNGFPLSGSGLTTAVGLTNSGSIANQPILGTGQNAVCGAGLAGTFQFTTQGPVLFDNGSRSETVPCGVSGQFSPFGNGANALLGAGIGPGVNPLAPLVFTCTGAAVLAVGQAAGDAPVNVVYTSATGGFTAVGSTLITVASSPAAQVSVSCRPASISAGNPGAICTAQARDVNGVPLNGVTGSTVTWSTSDPGSTTILPCVVNVPGSINVTTVPQIAPQVSPNTPCQTATAQINGVNTSALFGLATVVLAASPTARPETVTVTATLGAIIPPEFACLVSPYLPSGFAAAGAGAPLLSGCGSANPVGLTGLATALSAASTGLGAGIIALPPASSASTTVNVGPLPGLAISGPAPGTPLSPVAGTAATPSASPAPAESPAPAAPSAIPSAPAPPQFTLPAGTVPVATLDPATGGYSVTLTVCGTDAQNNPVAGETIGVAFSGASGDSLGQSNVTTDDSGCFTGSVVVGTAGGEPPAQVIATTSNGVTAQSPIQQSAPLPPPFTPPGAAAPESEAPFVATPVAADSSEPVAGFDPASGYSVAITFCSTDAQERPVRGDTLMLSFASDTGQVLGQTSVITDDQGCYSSTVPMDTDSTVVPAEVRVTTSSGMTVQSPILPPPVGSLAALPRPTSRPAVSPEFGSLRRPGRLSL